MRPQEANPREKTLRPLGLDRALPLFPGVRLATAGQIDWWTRVPLGALMSLMAPMPPVVIGMDTCRRAHD